MIVINKYSGIEAWDLNHLQSHTMMHTVIYDKIWMMHNSLLAISIMLTCTILNHS